MISGDIGFDDILSKPIILPNSISVSVSGNHIVSSSYYGDTFLEHVDNDGIPPVKIIPESSDTIGFFGRTVDLVAIATNNILRIIHLYKMEILATIEIRPGTLYVPPSGKSGVIGIVSPQGQNFTIDDELNIRKGPLNIGKNYQILWSSNVTPVGYMWVEEDYSKLYIRSTTQENGATFASSNGFTMYGVWANPTMERHEAFIVDRSEKNILKKVYSTPEKLEIENIHEFPEGSVITDVSLMSDGRPSVVSAIHNAENISYALPPETQVSKLIKNITSNNEKNTSAQCVGSSSYISWSQTPVTSPVAAVTNYGISNRPRHEIKGIKTLGENIIPTTNIVRKIPLNDKQILKYRLVSPYSTQHHLVDNVVIITDEQGFCAAGAYSPTVRILYEMGLGVAIVPIRKYNKKALNNYFLDLVDVSIDIKKSKIGKKVSILSSGDLNSDAIKALQHRQSQIDRSFLIDPTDDEINTIKNKFSENFNSIITTDDLVEDDYELTEDNKIYTNLISSKDPNIIETISNIIL